MWKCLLLLLCLSLILPVSAGAQEIAWDPPIRLTSEDSVVQFSAIAADLQGGVHVFWGYKPESDQPSNLLFYRYRDETGWSEATDLFAGPEWDSFLRPTVILGENNRLHLLWNGTQALYYSSAPAQRAYDPRNWQKPVSVVQADALGQTAIVVTDEGVIHVVYSQNRPGTNVMYVYSDDQGLTWSAPQSLSSIASEDEQAPEAANIAIDRDGVLHVVWNENYPPKYLGRQVFYVQSSDGGMTWTAPNALSDFAVEDDWNALSNIWVDSQNELHLLWAGCGRPVARCYRSSSDQGRSWSTLVKPFQNLGGSSGRDATAIDPYDNMYWVGSLRYPQAVYFSMWKADHWQDPPTPVIGENQYGRLGSAHFPQMVVAQGNQLHLSMVEGDAGPLWYLHGQSSYPRIEPAVLENYSTPVPSGTATDVLVVEAAPSEGPTMDSSSFDKTPNVTTGLNPLVTSMLAVTTVLTLCVVTVRRRNRR